MAPTPEERANIEKILGDLGKTDMADSAELHGDRGSAFGNWLNRERISRRLTRAELSRSSGINGNVIYKIEAGYSRSPRATTIESLERALRARFPKEEMQELNRDSTVSDLGRLLDFDPYSSNELPREGGVYVLYDISDRPIYVGKTGSIRKRIGEHEEKFWFKKPIVENGAYILIRDETLRDRIEKVLIRFLKSNAVINKAFVDRD